MPSDYFVVWWNLENLFDEEHAPPARRTDKVLRAIQTDIAGWTPQRRDRKVAQLASVIARDQQRAWLRVNVRGREYWSIKPLPNDDRKIVAIAS
jgi:hypothetical protein